MFSSAYGGGGAGSSDRPRVTVDALRAQVAEGLEDLRAEAERLDRERRQLEALCLRQRTAITGLLAALDHDVRAAPGAAMEEIGHLAPRAPLLHEMSQQQQHHLGLSAAGETQEGEEEEEASLHAVIAGFRTLSWARGVLQPGGGEGLAKALAVSGDAQEGEEALSRATASPLQLRSVGSFLLRAMGEGEAEGGGGKAVDALLDALQLRLVTGQVKREMASLIDRTAERPQSHPEVSSCLARCLSCQYNCCCCRMDSSAGWGRRVSESCALGCRGPSRG